MGVNENAYKVKDIIIIIYIYIYIKVFMVDFGLAKRFTSK